MIIYTCVKCKKLVQSLKGLCPVCEYPSPPEDKPYIIQGLNTAIHWRDGDCLENTKSHRHPDWIEQWEEVERRHYNP